MCVNKYYRCDESKLGNQRVQSHLGWAVHLQTEPRDALLPYLFLCTHWLPPIHIRHFFLCCSEREREQKKGRVVRTRTRSELNTMEGSVLPSQFPFIGMVECFVTE